MSRKPPPQLIAIEWPGMSSERNARHEFCPLREVIARNGFRRRDISTKCRLTGRVCDHGETRQLPSHCPISSGLTIDVEVVAQSLRD